MKIVRFLWTCAAAALLAATLAPARAEAIPAFARKYKLSCTTCHAPFPRLKPFGDEFAANGFALPGQESDRSYIDGGDDLLHLNRDFPVAVRLDAFATVFEDQEGETALDLQSPFGLKLLSGGTLAQDVGYYFYFYMSERGEVAGVEDAYIHFNDVGGIPLDIMVGQFQACDPLMKRELRLTYEDYAIYKTRIGLSGNNLAYDRGIIASYDLQSSGTNLVGMLLNGNGKAPAEDGRFDSDRLKNGFLRVGQAMGEYLEVGYFGYYGEELGAAAGDAPVFTNRLLYHGPDIKAGNGTVDLTFQYLRRRDTNPLFVAGASECETDGIVAEVVLSPHSDRSRHVFTLLYNRIDSDLDANDYETFTVGATRLARRNLRLTAEFTYDLEVETARGALGVVSAF